MYKTLGLAMFGVFAMMVLPSGIDATQDEIVFWGHATIEHLDANGDVIMTQTVHNRLVDTGETFLLNQGFDDGTLQTDTEELVNSICVTAEASFADTSETTTASSFDTADTFTATNCVTDDSVDTSTTQGTAVIGPLTFDTANLDAAGETITGIGVCQGVTANNNDFADCATGNGGAGILFAQVNVTDTTLNTGETVQITYTFDLRSAAN